MKVNGEFKFKKKKEYVRVVLFVEQDRPALLSDVIDNIEKGAANTDRVSNVFLQSATVHDAKEAVEMIELDPTYE